MIFHSHVQIKLIFTRKVVHLASFWKWGFLELGNGLFIVYLYAGINDDFFFSSTTLYSVGHYMSIPYMVSIVQGLPFWHGKKFKRRFSTTVGACVGNLLPNNLNQLVSQAMLSHTTDTGQRFVPSWKGIRYSMNTYQICERGAASLSYRNRTVITVLRCKQKSYPIWFSCRREDIASVVFT